MQVVQDADEEDADRLREVDEPAHLRVGEYGLGVPQVYVAAGHRGGGVSDTLLAEAERLVAGGGHPMAWLAVVPGNARARRFYERNGWTDDGGFLHEAPDAGRIVMVPCRRYVKQVA